LPAIEATLPEGPKADRRPDGKRLFGHIAVRGDRPTVTAHGSRDSYGDMIVRVARVLVRLAEPLLIMAALFAAPIIAKEISRGRAITD
jgi:hypothetical protein